MPDHDLVIRGGTIVDGTGGEIFEGDVAVRNGKIIEVGAVLGTGAEEIDAKGKLVTPGFVDIHTHYDGQVTWENRLRPSSDHGVTTVLMGNCGVGFAPAKPEQHQLMVQLMEGVEDIPEVVMTAGIPWNWESFPDYLDALDQRSADIDFAAQLPHSPLRVYVMGERGANREPPTDDDLARMRNLTAEAVRAGAFGVSTSRALVHRMRDGRLAPSTTTEETELLSLAAGLRDANGGVFQLLCRTDEAAAGEFALVERLQAASGRPISFTLAQSKDDWRDFLDGVNRAAANKIPIRGQIFPRPVGFLFGLDLSFHPFSLNPSYRPLADLPLAEKVAALRDPAMKQKLLSEEPSDPNPFYLWYINLTDMMFNLGDPPNYAPDPSESLAARAARAGRDLREYIYDELLKDEGRTILYGPRGNMDEGRLDNGMRHLADPGVLLGLGDGGAHYGMICDASYPTYLLLQGVRDASADRRVELPLAIRKLSRDNAEFIGMGDRGVLRPGFKADVNVIDLDELELPAPRVARDLPANGRRLTQRAKGYDATIVSGAITYRHGEATGALPGRLVRRT